MKKNQYQLTIRPGQRVPYRKGSRQEILKRRKLVAQMIILKAKKMIMHQIIMLHFNRQWRTTDRDIQFVTRMGPKEFLESLNARARVSHVMEIAAATTEQQAG